MDTIGRVGDRLASRYQLVELFPEQYGLPEVTQWYAVDEVLDRSVRIIALGNVPRRAEVLDAARRASLIDDGRVVQILSVGADFVVTELPLGTPLSALTGGQPMAPEQAAAVTGEVASIISSIAVRGIRHLAMDATLVRVGDQGEVYLDGVGMRAVLAGVDTSSLTFAEADKAEAQGLATFFASLVVGHTSENVLKEAADMNLSGAATVLMDRARSALGLLSPGEVVRVLAPWEAVNPAVIAETRAARLNPNRWPGFTAEQAAAAGRAEALAEQTRQAQSAAGQPADDADDGAAGTDSSATESMSQPVLPAVGGSAGNPDTELGIVPVAPVDLHPHWHTTDSPVHTAQLPVIQTRAADTLQAAGTTPAEAATSTQDRANASTATHDGAAQNQRTDTEDATGAPTAVFTPVTASVSSPASAPNRAADSHAGTPGGQPASVRTTASDRATHPTRKPVAERMGASQPAASGARPTHPARPNKRDYPKNARGERLFNPSWIVLVGSILLVVLLGVWAVTSLLRPLAQPNITKPTISAPGTSAASDTPSATPSPTAAATASIASATVLNPLTTDPNQDSPGTAGLLVDGDPSTVYSTYYYLRNSKFGLVKEGMGFAIKLNAPAQVSSVTLGVQGSGGNIQWRDTTADAPNAGTVLAEGSMNGDTTLTASSPITTDTIILWVTDLPTNAEGKYQLDISEITVK